MGPPDYRAARADHCVPTTREAKNGWGWRARTPITRARTWRPTIRRTPSSDGHGAGAGGGVSRQEGRTVRWRSVVGPHLGDGALLQMILERPARPEARHATGRDPDGLAGARIVPVALGAPAHQERAEAADGHL